MKIRQYRFRKYFSNQYFRVYTGTDLTGAELGGALKNCLAIAAGISDGLGFGDNSKAALITRGINEIFEISKYYDVNPKLLWDFRVLVI